METKHPYANFNFDRYLITKSSIEINSEDIDTELRFSIEPAGELDQENNQFVMTLEVEVSDESQNFRVNLMLKAWFSYKTNDMDMLKQYIGINAPAIVFPYIRAYVSNITALGGMAPIIMPTINISEVGRQLVEKL